MLSKKKVGLDGDRITVTCKVVGNPKPEITWSKANKPIKKSKVLYLFHICFIRIFIYLFYIYLFSKQDFSIEFNGEVAKLTINDAYTEDSGDYSCEVWNEAGQQTSPFKITIKEKKGKPKRSRAAPKPGEAEKKDEDELRREKRKSEAAKKDDGATSKKNSTAAPPPTIGEPVYEEEGPRRAASSKQPAAGGDSSGPGSRKTSQPAIKLDIIDEGKYF